MSFQRARSHDVNDPILPGEQRTVFALLQWEQRQLDVPVPVHRRAGPGRRGQRRQPGPRRVREQQADRQRAARAGLPGRLPDRRRRRERGSGSRPTVATGGSPAWAVAGAVVRVARHALRRAAVEHGTRTARLVRQPPGAARSDRDRIRYDGLRPRRHRRDRPVVVEMEGRRRARRGGRQRTVHA